MQRMIYLNLRGVDIPLDASIEEIEELYLLECSKHKIEIES